MQNSRSWREVVFVMTKCKSFTLPKIIKRYHCDACPIAFFYVVEEITYLFVSLHLCFANDQTDNLISLNALMVEFYIYLNYCKDQQLIRLIQTVLSKKNTHARIFFSNVWKNDEKLRQTAQFSVCICVCNVNFRL